MFKWSEDRGCSDGGFLHQWNFTLNEVVGIGCSVTSLRLYNNVVVFGFTLKFSCWLKSPPPLLRSPSLAFIWSHRNYFSQGQPSALAVYLSFPPFLSAERLKFHPATQKWQPWTAFLSPGCTSKNRSVCCFSNGGTLKMWLHYLNQSSFCFVCNPDSKNVRVQCENVG